MSEMQMYEIEINNKKYYLAKDIYEAGKNPCLSLINERGERVSKLTVNLGFKIKSTQVAFKTDTSIEILTALIRSDIIVSPPLKAPYGMGYVYVYDLTEKGMSL